MNIHEFSEGELNVSKQVAFMQEIGDPTLYQSKQPIGFILGGQPAAGKSGLIKKLRRDHRLSDLVVINGDEYRQHHPRKRELDEQFGQDSPKYTQKLSNAVVDFLKAECLRLRCNFIIEGTMRTYAVIERTAQEVR